MQMPLSEFEEWIDSLYYSSTEDIPANETCAINKILFVNYSTYHYHISDIQA